VMWCLKKKQLRTGMKTEMSLKLQLKLSQLSFRTVDGPTIQEPAISGPSSGSAEATLPPTPQSPATPVFP
jgi:hypothetical protein